MLQSGSRRWWALAALALGSLIMNVDTTVLNLALPTLSGALHASSAELQWFIDAYTLTMAGLMLPAGFLGDRFGRRRVMIGALVLFAGASVACAYAPSAGAFIAARALAGLGAACFAPLGIATLTVLFSTEERPKAIAILMGMSMAAMPTGPIVGGWLLTHAWWGSVFLINVPIVAVALVVLVTIFPESRGTRATGLDIAGVGASSGALISLVYGIIEAGQSGWTEPGTLAALGLGAALLVAFVAWELWLLRRRESDGEARLEPLVDLTLFTRAGFTWGTLLLTTMTFALFGLSFSAPQLFQAVKGFDPQTAGFWMLPNVLGLLIGSTIGNRVLSIAGTKITVATGFVILGSGLLLGSFTTISSPDLFILTWIPLTGFGVGFVLPGTNAAALATLPRSQAGVGSSVLMAVRMVGGAFGVAVLGAILNGVYRGHLDLAGVPAAATAAVQKSVYGGIAVAHQLGSPSLLASAQTAFVSGMDSLLVVCGVIALAGAALAIAFLPRDAEAGGAEAAELKADPGLAA